MKGAYLQRGTIRIEIFMRTPGELVYVETYAKHYVWKLSKLLYGIGNPERQWMLFAEQ